MRKSVAWLLLITMSVGCSTTTRARLTAGPPAINSEAATTIYGLVLIDGTQVEFRGPAELRMDGSVQGSAPIEYAGELEGARAYRLTTYEADQIAAYKVGKDGKKDNQLRTVALLALGIGALVGVGLLLTDSDSSDHFLCFC